MSQTVSMDAASILQAAIDSIQTSESFAAIRRRIEQGEMTLAGHLVGSSRAFLIASLARELHRPTLVLTSEQSQAYLLAEDLQFTQDQTPDAVPVFVFPHLEILPYESQVPELTIRMERLAPIQYLIQQMQREEKATCIIVAPMAAALKRMPPIHLYSEQSLHCGKGGELNRDAVTRWLTEQGYEFRDLVAQRGDFSVRGDIIDIYSYSYPEPVRIELWGDEVESIRLFHVSDQRSIEEIDEAVFFPGNEDPLLRTAIQSGKPLPLLLDLLGGDALLLGVEPDELTQAADDFDGILRKRWNEETRGEKVDHELHLGEEDFHKEQDVLLEPPERLYTKMAEWETRCEDTGGVWMTEFSLEPAAHHVNLNTATPELFGEDQKSRIQGLCKLCDAGGQVLIVCDNAGQQSRLDEILDAQKKADDGASETYPVTIVGTLYRGFHLQDKNILLCTDREIFGRYKRFRTPVREGIALPVAELVDLQPGDYVVHIDHGIGLFKRLKRMAVEERESEFLELGYADGGILYVPIDQIDRVGRYVGGDAAAPALARLGTKTWDRTKARARQAIEDMAEELLELYATRQVRKGHSFTKDTHWQHEFEASFLYEETPDQWRAIEDVKRDMENDEPMDRLVCGDVGFGKTEVAIRAAFKAVMDGKQVAVLAPTTILAQQHFNNFSERFADYPVQVSVLSRFVSPGDQKKTIDAIASGEVDVCVGTHRLLSKDIVFKDMGLVIVDEEQRFGVKHKERLRQMKKLVDTLTLTATPIPRTMYMSLSGIRNMSLMSTPPKNRLPIETYVMEWSQEVVETAILREMSRDGQVYFVHNRIESIFHIANKIQEWVPHARICVGHGQMEERELEKIMASFTRNEYDILIATTIIENGIDIPNVNTIIINEADHFGLSQLYQLRGRVGRDRHRAYCYLLVPSKKSLSSISRRRLLALQEHNQLGSGFHLAMRDMEIRGVGNILGREQHGHMAAIGFDLYSKMLQDTVGTLRGKKGLELEWETSLEMSHKGAIPSDYIESSKQRMAMHQRIAKIKTRDEIISLRSELEDIYGKTPAPVERLFESLDVRVRAHEIGFDLIRIQRNHGFLRYHSSVSDRFDPLRVLHLDGWNGWKLTVSAQDDTVAIEIRDSHKKSSISERILEFFDVLTAEEVPEFEKKAAPPEPKKEEKPRRRKIRAKRMFRK